MGGDQAAHGLALAAGMASTVLFGVQYLPQIYLNWKRKSVKSRVLPHWQGFSVSGVLIKYVGSSTLLVHALYASEALPVQLFGLVSFAQLLALIVQIANYNSEVDATRLYSWLAFPLLPTALVLVFPSSVGFTALVKPGTMVASHIPQLYLCHKQRSVQGLSMMSQHANMAAGILGAYMCAFIPPKTMATYLLYLFAVLQAGTTYWAAFVYGGAEQLVSGPEQEIKELRAGAATSHMA
eukprot:tig00000718_g3721.t1